MCLISLGLLSHLDTFIIYQVSKYIWFCLLILTKYKQILIESFKLFKTFLLIKSAYSYYLWNSNTTCSSAPGEKSKESLAFETFQFTNVTVIGRIILPCFLKDIHILIYGTSEYVRLQSKGELDLQMQLRLIISYIKNILDFPSGFRVIMMVLVSIKGSRGVRGCWNQRLEP